MEGQRITMKRILLSILLFSQFALGYVPYPIPVPQGGTGIATLTSGNILIGQGTSAISAATGTALVSAGTWSFTNTHSTLGLQFGVDPGDGSAKFDMRDALPINFYADSGSYQGSWITSGLSLSGVAGLQIGGTSPGSNGSATLSASSTGLQFSPPGGVIFPNARTGAGIYSGNATYTLGITKGGSPSSYYNIVTGADKGGATALTILRGQINAANCALVSGSGEGWTGSGTNLQIGCTVTFSQAFGSNAICTATLSGSSATGTVWTGSLGTSTVVFTATTSSYNANIICIGPRGD
jgi:hypothetical protein